MRELTFVLILWKGVLFIWLMLHDSDHFEVIEVKIGLVKTVGHVDQIEWWIVWLLRGDHPGPIEKLIRVDALRWLLFLFNATGLFFSFFDGLFGLGGLVIARPGLFEVGRITRACLYHQNILECTGNFLPFKEPRCSPFLYPLSRPCPSIITRNQLAN
jgi:hypothetical protein